MKLVWKWGHFLCLCFVLVGCNSTEWISNGTELGIGEIEKEAPSGPPLERISRRISKDFLFKSLNGTRRTNSSASSSGTSQFHNKRSHELTSPTGQVHIIESGSSLRTRGDARVLKRGTPASRFTDSVFTLRNSLKQKNRSNSGYIASPPGTGVSSTSSYENIPLIPIPGDNIPPPVYTFGGSPASPGPPSSSHGSYSSGSPSPVVVTYRPGTTSHPSIILPPEEVTPEPGPKPIIGPGPGTSVPIIGGGGGGNGGSGVLPPSPPPDEIFPPAPPPDEDEFEDEEDLGRRLKVSGAGGNGGRGVGVRTRTRVIPSQRVVAPVESSSPARESVRTSGGTLRRDRLRDKVKEFKTTIVEEIEPVSEEIIVDDPNVITDFVFSDIKCFKTRQNEYFGATIHLKNGFHLPYIRDRPQDPLTSEECRLDTVEGTRGSYHMTVTDLRGCGVEQCGEAMCLTMVFPRVPMLALADDEVTTIKCIPQKSTISDTKTISFAGDSTENRRSSSTVEGGIQEFVAEVGVFRQNPGSTNGLFVKRVNSGGVVQLGEPLQLRSVVRGTDGWKYSKLTDVKVWRMRDNFSHRLDNLDPSQASEVITLVDAQGCRNDEYIVIADDHPIKDPRNDMVHHFTFKAFLFRGQRVNEPLVVTARVHACQEYQDCLMECESGRRRVRRSPVEIHNASAIVHGFDSQLALRVVGLKDHPSSILDDEFPFDYGSSSTQESLKERNRTLYESGSMTCGEKMFASGLGGGCVMLLVCGLGLALFTYCKQGRLQSARKNEGRRRQVPPPPGYRDHPPPSARAHTSAPYNKPLPPPPTSSSCTTTTTTNSAPLCHPSRLLTSNAQSTEKGMSEEISHVAKLLQELAKNNTSDLSKEEKGKPKSSGKSSSSTADLNNNKHKVKDKPTSDYACIDETNSSTPTSSSASSSEDLSKHAKKGKDGVYIVYCYNDKTKNKVVLPRSAPSSTRLRRKRLMGKSKEAEDDNDDYQDAEDFLEEDSETMCSQTEESDEYGEIGGGVGGGAKSGGDVGGSNNNNTNGKMQPVAVLAKDPVIRRTVREVKKKSKQNNSLAFASTRSSSAGGIIRRRVSSVYREGYLSGIRGAVVAAVQGSKNSIPVRFKKAPSLGNIPRSALPSSEYAKTASPEKRINFSVRERRRSGRKRQQKNYHHQEQQYSSEGMLSEATIGSDLDSAYSGSNCSKLTEDHLYELKRTGAGRYPDFRDFQILQKNLLDVQRQLRMNSSGGGSQAQGHVKQEVSRTSSAPSINKDFNGNSTTAVAVSHASPPLSLGETKTTHFVTRDDDATTKILIVPETHV